MSEPEFSLGSLLDEAASAWGTRPFLRYGERSVSFQHAKRAAVRATGLLVLQGVQPGDRILIARADPITAVVTMLAALRIGAVCTIADPAAPRFVAENVLSDLAPSAVMADGESSYATRPQVSEASQAGVLPPGAALIIYTSGSTGRPKGIVASHRNVLFAASAIQERLALQPTDRVACLSPLTFDYGLYQVFLALVSGCAVIFGSPGKLGGSLLSFLARERVTVLPSVPTLSRMLLSLAERSSATVPALRVVTNTGEAMSEALLKSLQATFPDAGIFPMFGLTECKRVSILLPSEIAARPGSVGRPLAGTRCAIVDEHGVPLAAHEVGQLIVSGPHVTLGYWNDDELTNQVFRQTRDDTRTLFTGDKAWMDEEGYLFFAGREDNIFKRKGYRVSAAEIAFAAEHIDGVTGAVCLPPRLSANKDVVLVVTGTAPADRILAGLEERVYRHQIPDRIEVVDELPLTRHGKTDVRALATLLEPVRAEPEAAFADGRPR